MRRDRRGALPAPVKRAPRAPRPSPPAGRAPQGARPSWPRRFLFCLAPGLAGTTRTRGTGDERGRDRDTGLHVPRGAHRALFPGSHPPDEFYLVAASGELCGPPVKVKGKRVLVESARNTGDEWATVRSELQVSSE